MRNIFRGAGNVSHAEAIGKARGWAEYLLNLELSGTGGHVESAAERVQTKWGVASSLILRLRQRDVTDMLLSNWWMLGIIYDRAVAIQEKRLAHEVELAKAAGLNAANTPSLVAAQAALRQVERKP